MLDVLALVPVLLRVAWLYHALWERLRRLSETTQMSPGRGNLAVFAVGLGLGLVLASGISSFCWRSAFGAFVVGMITIVTVMVVARA